MARLDTLFYGMNYAPEPTGVGLYSGEIGAFLAAKGQDVLVVTAPPHYPGWRVAAPHSASRYASETVAGVKVIRCPLLLRDEMRGFWRLVPPISFAVSSLPVIIWQILWRRPRAVFCVEPTLLSAPAAILAAKLVGSRLVLHVQDLEIDAAFAVGHLKSGLLQKAAGLFERLTLKGFDRVIAISHRMADRLADKGVPRDRMSIIRNWVDLGRIKPHQGENSYRAELGIAADTKVALYSGNIGAKQALEVAFEAAKLLAERSDILFVVAGEGPEKKSLFARYGSLPNVRFLPLQPAERLSELLSLADVHILPQQAGMADLVLPSKLAGMLASGKPVLVTADKGTELYDVLDGTAILVPAGDTAAMAREIAVLADSGSHPQLGDGRKLAQIFAHNVCLEQIRAEVTVDLGVAEKSQPVTAKS